MEGRTGGGLTSLVGAVVSRVAALILEKQRAHGPRPERLCRVRPLRPTNRQPSHPQICDSPFRGGPITRYASPNQRRAHNRRTTAQAERSINPNRKQEKPKISNKKKKQSAREVNSLQLRHLNDLPPPHHRPAPPLLNIIPPHFPHFARHSQVQSCPRNVFRDEPEARYCRVDESRRRSRRSTS